MSEELFLTFKVKHFEQIKFVDVLAELNSLGNIDCWSEDLYFAIADSFLGFNTAFPDILDVVAKGTDGGFKPISKDRNVLLSSIGIIHAEVMVLHAFARLLGGSGEGNSATKPSTRKVEFTGDCAKLCKDIVKNSYEMVEMCHKLRDELIIEGLITDTSTYDEVLRMKNLMMALLKYIGLGLEVDIEKSRYGLNRVSDFVLYNKMNCDTPFNNVAKEMGFFDDKGFMEKLKYKRNLLRSFMSRTRDQVLLNFELPDTPDKREERAEMKAKKEAESRSELEIVKKLASSKIAELEEEENQQKTKKSKVTKNHSTISQTEKVKEDGPTATVVEKNDNAIAFQFMERPEDNASHLCLYDKYNPTTMDPIVLDFLIGLFDAYKISFADLKIWDCCGGMHQVLAKGLIKLGLSNVVTSDSQNFAGLSFVFDLLTSEITFQDYNMIVTAPPSDTRNEIITKLLSQSKPFAMLLPLSVVTSSFGKRIFSGTKGVIMIPIASRVRVLKGKKNDKKVLGDLAWFVFNLPNRDMNNPLVIQYFQRPIESVEQFDTDDEKSNEQSDDDEIDLVTKKNENELVEPLYQEQIIETEDEHM